MIDPVSAGADLRIALEDPGHAEIVALLHDGEAYSAALYPAESNHHLPIEAFRAANVRFLVARDGGTAIGTGAIVLNGDWAELKAMWVAPGARGRGVSKALLRALEATVRDAGITVLRLETGIESHAALGLYVASGFVTGEPFGDYRPDPLSVFMHKALS
jgi:putative acetyltransferase